MITGTHLCMPVQKLKKKNTGITGTKGLKRLHSQSEYM